jgi:hypothetical protein
VNIRHLFVCEISLRASIPTLDIEVALRIVGKVVALSYDKHSLMTCCYVIRANIWPHSGKSRKEPYCGQIIVEES